MTIVDDRELSTTPGQRSGGQRSGGQTRAFRSPAARSARPAGMRPPIARRKRSSLVRPVVGPLHYRGSGVAFSRAVHKPRRVSTQVTIGLSALSALITVWLGLLGQFSGESAGAVVPDRLAVVQVEAGESLEHLAGRVAPDRPARQVAQRIRELNQLGSAPVWAGQTLISPIG